MPARVLLDEPRPLLVKVAEWMAGQEAGRPMDFSDWAVVVPTAGAGRRLRERLALIAAGHGTGILPPRCVTPMGLLDLYAQDGVATAEESTAAWARSVRAATDDVRRELLPGFRAAIGNGDALRIAVSLRSVAALLAEAGLSPGHPAVVEKLAFDEARWSALAALFAVQRNTLAEAGLTDPDDARMAAAGRLDPPPGVRRVVVAGVPDLNSLCRGHLAGMGDKVTILADAAGGGRFDEWGAPADLAQVRVPGFTVCAEAESEAELAAHNFRSGVALCLADPTLAGPFRRALERRGVAVFDPAGSPLAASEPLTMLRRWVAFCRTRRIGDLRLAVECPGLARALGGVDEVLAQVDSWMTEGLCETLDDVRQGTARVRSLIERFRLDDDPGLTIEFWEAVFAGEDLDSATAEAIEVSAGQMRGILASRLCPADPGEIWDLMFQAASALTIYPERADHAADLNGWLEAAWLGEEKVLLAGCVEGALPDSVDGHAFLPDSSRAALGLQTNAGRHARDAFLLANLLASRPDGAVRLTFSRRGAGGDPLKPSRLLLDVPDAELPGRVSGLFTQGISLLRPAARTIPWPLRVFSGSQTPDALSVTEFGAYLRCPLRYFLARRLGMVGCDHRVRELDALRFGDLFHRAIEGLAGDPRLRESADGQEIGDFLVRRLEELFEAGFGKRRTFALRVQQESLQARLRAVARVEAAERAAGWRITGAEEDMHDLLVVGGMKVRARVDRIEVNERTGRRRIIDYKTFAKAATPGKSHLEKAVDGLPPEELADGAQRWVNLQLPLYLALARERWKGDSLIPEVAYFLAPARVEDTGIATFEIPDALFESAMRCADSVAERIRRGVFWPPRNQGAWDDFETLFAGMDGIPAFDHESVARLQGSAS